MSDDRPPDLAAHPWFFCGIGGSGMLPLALILRGRGATIAGSDRSRDQGRSAGKFAWLEAQGIALHPQDGSGIVSPDQTLVASAAVEDSVPEVVCARELGCPRLSRAKLLATLFNAAPEGIAVGGTSGKSTVTGMLGWILTATAHDPTIMNGAVMKNFVADDAPFASARVGSGETFVSEVDESDGSIALYRPKVAVLNNVTLDHKSMDELRELFRGFLAAATIAVVNLDDPEAAALLPWASHALTFGESPAADFRATEIEDSMAGIRAMIEDRRYGTEHQLALRLPGRHNLANALAAIVGAAAIGVPVADAVAALAGFAGLARRFEVVGTSPSGVTVIDDFGHNPDKVAATLATLRTAEGRVLAMFQPHGFGPLRQMGRELAQTFVQKLTRDDVVLVCDPVYFGGTTDRSVGSADVVGWITAAGGNADYIPKREECGDRLVALARPGDRVVVMGARDDTLSEFARGVLARLA
jgi:UDP-N-acetylmuramate--alanine ligase